MLELQWIENDVWSTAAHPNWQRKDAVEALMKKRYKVAKLKRGNIFLKTCSMSERVYSCNTTNSFMFYKEKKEKLDVKPPFMAFQQSVLQLMKLAPS